MSHCSNAEAGTRKRVRRGERHGSLTLWLCLENVQRHAHGSRPCAIHSAQAPAERPRHGFFNLHFVTTRGAAGGRPTHVKLKVRLYRLDPMYPARHPTASTLCALECRFASQASVTRVTEEPLHALFTRLSDVGTQFSRLALPAHAWRRHLRRRVLGARASLDPHCACASIHQRIARVWRSAGGSARV